MERRAGARNIVEGATRGPAAELVTHLANIFENHLGLKDALNSFARMFNYGNISPNHREEMRDVITRAVLATLPEEKLRVIQKDLQEYLGENQEINRLSRLIGEALGGRSGRSDRGTVDVI